MRSSNVVRLAWRNLGRHPRRTVLALVAIASAQCIVLLMSAIVTGEGDWLMETITGPLVGHVQLHAPGWRDDRAMDRFIPDATALVTKLRADPELSTVQPRIYAPALAALKEEGQAVVVLGVDPKAEADPWGLLASVPTAQLPEQGTRRAVVGSGLARAMGLKPGDELAIVGQGADGSVANELFTVSAVVEGPVSLVNRLGVLVPLADAQELFVLPDAVHEVALHAKGPDATPALVARLKSDPALKGVEVARWAELVPDIASMMAILDVASWIVMIIFFLAAGVGVANTLLMSTFERTRELGMLTALGTRPSRLVGMVLSEAALLGVIGVVVGSVLGTALIVYFHRYGLDLAALAPQREAARSIQFAGLQFDMMFYPRADWQDSVRAVAAVLFTSALAGLWPSSRVARLQPTEAMRA